MKVRLALVCAAACLSACSDGGGSEDKNSAPSASDVTIADDDGGLALAGDSLTGGYTYLDGEGDLEGSSLFRWLRDGVAITGATSDTYVLVQADVPAAIVFEVTPVAASGTKTGTPVMSPPLNTSANSAPTATNVAISDDNGGSAVVGDNLTGSYTYGDVDGDPEGATSFRWLRDSVAIAGATSSTYLLTQADVPAAIVFEVTPVAASGATTGTAESSAALNTGVAPVVTGSATYADTNANGICDAGDRLVVPFDVDVVVNAAVQSDFDLAVGGDTLGVNAGVAAGPLSNEVTITLGMNPTLRTRGSFSSAATATNAPSGIDVSSMLSPDGIESLTGVDAVPSNPIDIVPLFVDNMGTFGNADSEAIVAGDLDGDGDLDIVAIHASGAVANEVFFNDGTGTFADSGQALGANLSRDAALGDVDGDGDLDLAVANDSFGGQSNRIYLNDGSGVFTDSGQAVGTLNSNGIAMGDLDRDGDLDLVITNFGVINQVFFNDGGGTFTDSGQGLGGANFSYGLALGDVDSDGDLDLVIANDDGQGNRVYSNDGAGVFTYTGQALTSDFGRDVVLGDVDGDGDLDMVNAALTLVAGTGDRVFLNDGTGTFVPSQVLGDTSNSTALALGDLDADGDLDIVVAVDSGGSCDGAGSIRSLVYRNDGAGTFSVTSQGLGNNCQNQSIVLGDIDGDGDLDVLLGNGANGTQQPDLVYINSLAGTFGTANFADSGQSLGNGASQSVSLGDVDGDGDLDKVVANLNQGNRIYLNDGTGLYADSGQALGTNNSTQVVLGDLDGDGDLDLAVANLNQGNRVYTNDGSGDFSDSMQSLGTGASQSMALGDVDSDGDLDLVVANNGQGNRIYLNDGSGAFTDSAQSLGTNASQSVVLADIDSDGDLDAVVANDGQGNRVYLNDGNGVFADSTQSLGANASRSLAIQDVDADGDLDLAFANENQGNRIYLNDGSGVFTDSGQSLAANASRSIVLEDVDGDGDVDLLVANNGQSGGFFSNDGSGIFTDTMQVFGSGASTGLAAGDLDADGDIDLVLSDSAGGNQILWNQ